MLRDFRADDGVRTAEQGRRLAVEDDPLPVLLKPPAKIRYDGFGSRVVCLAMIPAHFIGEQDNRSEGKGKASLHPLRLPDDAADHVPEDEGVERHHGIQYSLPVSPFG